MTVAEYKTDIEFRKDTLYRALKGELLSVCCEDCREN